MPKTRDDTAKDKSKGVSPEEQAKKKRLEVLRGMFYQSLKRKFGLLAKDWLGTENQVQDPSFKITKTHRNQTVGCEVTYRDETVSIALICPKGKQILKPDALKALTKSVAAFHEAYETWREQYKMTGDKDLDFYIELIVGDEKDIPAVIATLPKGFKFDAIFIRKSDDVDGDEDVALPKEALDKYQGKGSKNIPKAALR